jgi:hypothetical protein
MEIIPILSPIPAADADQTPIGQRMVVRKRCYVVSCSSKDNKVANFEEQVGRNLECRRERDPDATSRAAKHDATARECLAEIFDCCVDLEGCDGCRNI